MRLGAGEKNVNFSNCFLASGSLNFFGEGYWYHNWFRALVPGFNIIDHTTFVAKTTTVDERPGNLPLDKNFQPRELKQKCIKTYPFKGLMLNAVGLSGPGAKVLFKQQRWQKIERPF